MGLPSGTERARPFGIGRLVAAFVHRGRSPLEHVELHRVLAEMRDALDRGRAGPDDADALVPQLVQAAGGIAAGIVIVPAARVEGVSLEFLDPGYGRELGPVKR